MKALFETALEEVTKLHQTNEAIRAFGDFPTDFEWQDLPAYDIPGALLMADDKFRQ